MDTIIRKQTKTSMRREIDKITVTEVETTTITRKGQQVPEVRTVETVREYNVNDVPEEVRKRFGDIGIPHVVRPAVKDAAPFRGPSPRIEIDAASFPNPETDEELAKLNEECVKCHNMYRERHAVPPLSYSKKLADLAQDWARKLSDSDKLMHRKADGIGENIYMYYCTDPAFVVAAKQACDSWYAEIKHFVFGKEPMSTKSGHFTQMIWRDSKEVGMGRAKNSSGKQYIVANYGPPGNYFGKFTENVPPLKH